MLSSLKLKNSESYLIRIETFQVSAQSGFAPVPGNVHVGSRRRYGLLLRG